MRHYIFVVSLLLGSLYRPLARAALEDGRAGRRGARKGLRGRGREGSGIGGCQGRPARSGRVVYPPPLHGGDRGVIRRDATLGLLRPRKSNLARSRA